MHASLKTLLFSLLFLPALCYGVQGASPAAITVTQPDGSKLTVVGKGTMYVSYTETKDGYVVVKNKKDIYEYAVRDSTGDLIPSGIKAHQINKRTPKERSYLKKKEKHLSYTGEKMQKLLKEIENSHINP